MLVPRRSLPTDVLSYRDPLFGSEYYLCVVTRGSEWRVIIEEEEEEEEEEMKTPAGLH